MSEELRRCELCGLPWNRCEGHGRATLPKEIWPKFVNVGLVNRSYGGPEEGGWWYNTYERVEFHPANNQRAVDAILAKVQQRFSNEGRAPISSVCCPGIYVFTVTDGKPEPESLPEAIPHYE